MSDDQSKKDGGITDELPTLPGPEPKRAEALSIEPVTQKKPSGTVIIQDRALPPSATQHADPMAAALPAGNPVSKTIPSDAQKRPQPTMLEPAQASQVAHPVPAAPIARTASSGSGSMIVYAIAGGALALGVVIGLAFYLTRQSDDDTLPEPIATARDASPAATTKPPAPTQGAPEPPVVPVPPVETVVTPPKPGTPGTPAPTTSTSAPPAGSNAFPPGFPTAFPTSLPTAFPTNLVPSSFPLPSAWAPK